MIAVSIQDLRPNSQDTSAFYLKQLYQLQANPNPSLPLGPSAIVNPPTFSPAKYAVWVNSLWFLSLVMSLSCAMVATSMQQWVRRYVKVTQPARCSPHKRARARAFFANGMDKFHFPWVVERLPAIVQLSVLSFFIGLLIYLFNINRVVFNTIAPWLAFGSVAYGCITLTSIFRLDCPYRILLTEVFFSASRISRHVFGLLTYIFIYLCYPMDFKSLIPGKRSRHWILRDVEEQVEEAISRTSSKIDTDVLDLALNALGEDDAWEKFFESIPGFYRSDVVKDLRRCLPNKVRSRVHHTLVEFFRRTLLSNSVSRSVKFRRLAICLSAADEIDTAAGPEYAFQNLIHQKWRGMRQSVEFGEFLRSWDTVRGNGRYIQWIIADIIANAHERDDHWKTLAMAHLGIPEPVFRDYPAHGDSVLLAIVINSIRHAIRTDFSSFCLLLPLSNVDIHSTLPGLQHDFCSLWNTLVQNAQDSGVSSPSVNILKAARHIYIAIHRGTAATPSAFFVSPEGVGDVLNQPSSYPFCNTPGHLPGSTPPVHDASTDEVAHLPATTSTLPPPMPASDSHPGDAALHTADEASFGHLPTQITQSFPPPYQVSPPNPVTVVDSADTPTMQATADHSAISASVTLGLRSTLTAGSVTGDQRQNVDHYMATLSMAPGTPTSPPAISHPSDVLPTDLRSCSTFVASQLDNSFLIPEHPPPNTTATASLAVHQETSISDGDVALDVTELGPPNDSQDMTSPAPTVATHHLHSATSGDSGPDSDTSRELSSPSGKTSRSSRR